MLLIHACRYRPNVALAFVSHELAFETLTECRQLTEAAGGSVLEQTTASPTPESTAPAGGAGGPGSQIVGALDHALGAHTKSQHLFPVMELLLDTKNSDIQMFREPTAEEQQAIGAHLLPAVL